MPISGQLTLAQIRTAAQQRADMVNSNFISTQEWNSMINQSAYELYDILTIKFEKYFVGTPYTLTTDGVTKQYSLPSDLYKLEGVDCPLSAGQNAYYTLKPFPFGERNRYAVPYIGFLGNYENLKYCMVGSTLLFNFVPQANLAMQIWYTPRMTPLVNDSDVAEGFDGWLEYILVDAALKALQKEESDCSVLMAQKQSLLKRIEIAASNRDAGMPSTVTDVYADGGYSDSGNGWY